MSRHNASRSNLGVAYSSYYLIRSYNYVNGSLPSGLYFNKAMSFVNAEIKKFGENIMLPHSWCRWGDEVVRYYMPKEISWSHEETSYTEVNWIGGPPLLWDDKLKDDIESILDSFLKKYPVRSKGWYEELLADHYDGAPFEFQKAYKGCRDILFDVSRANGDGGSYSSDVLIKVFQTSLSTFPADKLFKPVKEFIPTFNRLISYPLSGTKEDLFTANDISEEFWYWFSYFLRTHPRAHENIDEDTITYWKSEIEHETLRFYQNFDDHVTRLSEKFPEIINDDLLVPHLRDGRKRLQEWEESMKDFENIVEDLDDFLSNKISLNKDFNN